MIQTRPYEFMVSYTPQTQWIEKGGIKLWLAFFFIELGAGMFFVASLFDNLRAMSIGWLLCAVLGRRPSSSLPGETLEVLAHGTFIRVEDLLDFPRHNLCQSLSSARPGTHGLNPIGNPVYRIAGGGRYIRFPHGDLRRVCHELCQWHSPVEHCPAADSVRRQRTLGRCGGNVGYCLGKRRDRDRSRQ